MRKRQSGYILVIGAAHPDIFADYKKSQEDKIDKPGKLKYSIGGTAYNIAVNLGQHHQNVSLYSFIRAESLFTDLIVNRLEENGVRTNFVQRHDYMPESGFIALRKEGKLESAVTSSGITQVAFDRSHLKSAIKNAAFVVADCNLDENQLKLVVDVANVVDKKILVSGVSESKAKRIRNNTNKITLLSLNDAEIDSLVGTNNYQDSDLCDLCSNLNIKQIVVTQGENGYLVVDRDTVTHYPAPELNDIVSTSGTGDAFLAGICHYLYNNGEINWESAKNNISEYVSAVIKQDGSTVGATTKDNELSVRDRVNSQIERISGVSDYPWWEKAAIVIGVMSAVITISSFISGTVNTNDISRWVEQLISIVFVA